MALTLEEALVLKEITVPGYEKVIKVTCERTGLKAIICMHNTALGPTLGGTRIYPYTTFEAALEDVKRLAKGMTYKSAVADCGWGGGKSVIIADPKKDKSRELLLSFGEAVSRLKGAYICAEDVGCTPEDVLTISQATHYIVGLPHPKSSGDPAPFTAWGTLRGIQSTMKKIYGSDSLEGRTVAVQGVGSVGSLLVSLLFWLGAKIIVSDIDQEKARSLAKKYGADFVSTDKILSTTCDVFAPCAMGGVINPRTIGELRCRAIAGCANNQLLTDVDAISLMRRGILYAPDFVINAGGLINVTQEVCPEGYHPSIARDKVDHLYEQLLAIYDISEQNRISTHAAAVALADYRLRYGIGKRQIPPYFHHAERKR